MTNYHIILWKILEIVYFLNEKFNNALQLVCWVKEECLLIIYIHILSWLYIDVKTQATECITWIHYFCFWNVEKHINLKQRNQFGLIGKCCWSMANDRWKYTIFQIYFTVKKVDGTISKRTLLSNHPSNFDGVKPILTTISRIIKTNWLHTNCNLSSTSFYDNNIYTYIYISVWMINCAVNHKRRS